eukprot:GEMP01054930.1.p1 GENE.GEMP01054930.1~~GEMP01054930.1.p1  ORF type:complete len:322 (-),score=71.12 GEMP01054930.1:391-1356(-)
MFFALTFLGHAVAASFIIVSSPNDGKVLYGRLPTFQQLATEPNMITEPRDLIVDLAAPQGLAVYHRSALLVSDCDAQNIYMYDLAIAGDVMKAVNKFGLVQNIPGGARWLAVDAVGDLFYSVESNSEIFKVPSERIAAARASREPADPIPLYQGGSSETVSNPSGMAADNFFVYWGNKESGSSRGSVVAARARGKVHSDQAYPLKLAANENKVFGVCQVDGNVFYTAPNKMYAVKKSGGAISVVANEMTNPRGCTYDGDGSIYIADRGNNAIYKAPAHIGTALRPVKKLKKVMEVTAPCQVAFVHSSATSGAFLWPLLFLF